MQAGAQLVQTEHRITNFEKRLMCVILAAWYKKTLQFSRWRHMFSEPVAIKLTHVCILIAFYTFCAQLLINIKAQDEYDLRGSQNPCLEDFFLRSLHPALHSPCAWFSLAHSDVKQKIQCLQLDLLIILMSGGLTWQQLEAGLQFLGQRLKSAHGGESTKY